LPLSALGQLLPNYDPAGWSAPTRTFGGLEDIFQVERSAAFARQAQRMFV
jgi:hypothetical protein